MPPGLTKKMVLVGPAAPYRGGIAHFLHDMYAGLVERGHDVSVVNFTRQYPKALFPGKTQYDSSSTALPVSVRLIDSINPLSWRRTINYIRSVSPDVVIFKHWMPFFGPAYGFIARRLKASGIRVICVAHNALPHEKRPGDKTLSRYFFKACDGFVVMSSAVAKDLKELRVKGEIREVHHPVYKNFGDAIDNRLARKQLSIDANAPALLFFGFVRKYKGLQVLLESMPQVVEALPDIRLVVAGECYEDEQAYRDFVLENGLEKQVDLRLEYIPNEDIPVLFSAADVVVQPYKSATQSGVAQVAFHFDKPLIVTDVGGLAEVVPHEKAGLVIPPDSPEALSKAIIRFFEENMAEQLSSGVKQEKQKYSWNRLFEAVEQLVEK